MNTAGPRIHFCERVRSLVTPLIEAGYHPEIHVSAPAPRRSDEFAFLLLFERPVRVGDQPDAIGATVGVWLSDGAARYECTVNRLDEWRAGHEDEGATLASAQEAVAYMDRRVAETLAALRAGAEASA